MGQPEHSASLHCLLFSVSLFSFNPALLSRLLAILLLFFFALSCFSPLLSFPLPCPWTCWPLLSPACPCHMPPLRPGSLQGGTDLEKHRDLLMVENERLKQELRRCEAELQELRTQPPAAPCLGCEHVQVSCGLGKKAPLLSATPAFYRTLPICPLCSPTACRRAPSSETRCPSCSWRWRRTKECCQN